MLTTPRDKNTIDRIQDLLVEIFRARDELCAAAGRRNTKHEIARQEWRSRATENRHLFPCGVFGLRSPIAGAGRASRPTSRLRALSPVLCRRRSDHELGRGLNNLDIDVDGGTVVWRGRIASSHDRWLCVHCAQRVAGVLRVIDELNSEGEVDGAVRRRPR